MGGVFVAGNTVHDILVRPVDTLAWGTSLWVDSIGHDMGGNGANTAYAVASLGVPVRLMAFVGRDAEGDHAIRQLDSAGVDTRAMVRADSPTPCTVVLVNSAGERMILHRPGASLDAFPEPVEFTPGLVEGCSHFHLANAYALPNMRRHGAECLRRARAVGMTTSVDTGWDGRGEWMRVLGPCLPWTDLLFVNGEEARMLTGEPAPADAARVFLAHGARTVALKLGAMGCVVYSEGGELVVPGFEVEPIDSTGAGDCFAGGFLAGLERRLPLEAAARLANAAGALSVSRLGAVAGLLGFEKTLAWMAAARVRR